MGEFLPDYLIREQAAAGAFVIFALIRILAACIGCVRGWPIALVEKCVMGTAGLYCAPQLFDWLINASVLPAASAAFEGKVLGAAVALFFSPMISRRLGYE